MISLQTDFLNNSPILAYNVVHKKQALPDKRVGKEN
jgi:hypothetical protein